MIRPVPEAPALLIGREKQKTLVIADLHLGIEGELESRGISLPSQTSKTLKRILSLVERHAPSRLILLGDVKHNVPVASLQEWRELPAFFEKLSQLTSVEVVPGNHDGDLAGMLPRGVSLHSARGILIGKRNRVGLAHGHAWPDPELFRAKTLVLAHNHPTVEFRDSLGGRIVEPVWLRLKILSSAKLPREIRRVVEKQSPDIIVMPAFGELVSGAPVNRSIPKELIGPIFKSGAANMERAHVYLLDGTYLGTVGVLRRIVQRFQSER